MIYTGALLKSPAGAMKLAVSSGSCSPTDAPTELVLQPARAQDTEYSISIQPLKLALRDESGTFDLWLLTDS